MKVALDVNGRVGDLEVEPRDTLLDVLRDRLGLTGAHAGCEHGSCGACTVLLDGEPVRSCLLFAVQCAAHRIETIEAFGRPEQLHPVMDAFRAHHALQCGFCTPAMVLTAIALLRDIDALGVTDAPAADAVRHELAGNLCRCTGYAGIVDAVLDAAS
ncbi:MAG TPA: (2Fe-2S)-binding protein, partial [Acidimicrobiia bacterium]